MLAKNWVGTWGNRMADCLGALKVDGMAELMVEPSERPWVDHLVEKMD